MQKDGIMSNLGGAASTAGYTVAGAIAAGFARKKVAFLDTTMGKIGLILIGLFIVSYSKSDALKGVGVGVATNGALGFASSLGLAGMDGLGSTDGMGQVVQDENGMVYMVNGAEDFVPYELPVVSGVGQFNYGYQELPEYAMNGVGGADDMARM